MISFEHLLFSLFCLASLGQLGFWLFVFSRLAFRFRLSPSQPILFDGKHIAQAIPISVVICARNEAENLKAYLPKILQQDYPDFEVVLVNDASTDATADIVLELSKIYPALRLVSILEKKGMGKKAALTAGIEAAKNNWLLLTDADCYPLSKNWISGMAMGIAEGKDLVLAYAPYEEQAGSWLNKFIRFETVWTAVQYFGFALAGMPYMGVGRNLMYRKSAFIAAQGFSQHADLASGDDDLFVNQIITKKNFSTILLPQTFMYSRPKTRWSEYFTQKKRHLSVGNSYKRRHQIMLGMVSASHFLFYATIFVFSYMKISTIFVEANILVRMIVIWTVYGKTLRRLHENKLFWWIPLLDFFYVFFYLVFAPILFLRTQPRKWH
jgi:glycosyltransferase involved in cell wall biosynthesis